MIERFLSWNGSRTKDAVRPCRGHGRRTSPHGLEAIIGASVTDRRPLGILFCTITVCRWAPLIRERKIVQANQYAKLLGDLENGRR